MAGTPVNDNMCHYKQGNGNILYYSQVIAYMADVSPVFENG